MKKMILLLALILLVGCSQPEIEEIDDELEQSRKLLLEAEINESLSFCSYETDEFNNTFCFAEKAVYFKEQDVKYPFDVVKRFCGASNDSDMCYFYVAMNTGDVSLCINVKDKIGCTLVSNDRFCYTMSNREECLMTQAFMLQFVDLNKSAEICSSLPQKYRVESEDDLSCADIDFEPEEMNVSNRSRFLMTYVLSEIAEFEVEKVRRR